MDPVAALSTNFGGIKFLADSSLTRCDKDCEESWQYVEFLKNDINGNITEILTNFKTTQDGDKAVTKTMEKVRDEIEQCWQNTFMLVPPNVECRFTWPSFFHTLTFSIVPQAMEVSYIDIDIDISYIDIDIDIDISYIDISYIDIESFIH